MQMLREITGVPMTQIEIEFLAEAIVRRMNDTLREMVFEVLDDMRASIENTIGAEADRIAARILRDLEKKFGEGK